MSPRFPDKTSTELMYFQKLHTTTLLFLWFCVFLREWNIKCLFGWSVHKKNWDFASQNKFEKIPKLQSLLSRFAFALILK